MEKLHKKNARERGKKDKVGKRRRIKKLIAISEREDSQIHS